MTEGWVCSKCGRYAPTWIMCHYCDSQPAIDVPYSDLGADDHLIKTALTTTSDGLDSLPDGRFTDE